jgi:VWFA-related protein
MRWLILGVVCAFASRTVVSQEVTPTFRTDVEVVTLNVSVRLGNRPLLGLTESDFTVFDQGVAQTLTNVTYDSVPIDLTIIVDVSQSERGALQAIERDARRLTSELRREDRLRILAIDSYVHELIALSYKGEATARPLASIGGVSAVNDSIAAALLVPADPLRRRLVVAFTDAQDNASAISPAEIEGMARAGDSVFVLVLTPAVRAGGATTRLPFLTGEPAVRAIETVANVTGGQVVRQGTSLMDTLQRIIETFRQSYTLQYSPNGVASSGWHALEVRVNGYSNAEVRARSGYFRS